MRWPKASFSRSALGRRQRRLHRFPCLQRHAEALEPRHLLAGGGVTYQGGPVINNVAVETVFLGTAWANDPTLEQNAAQLDQFFGFVTSSSYMDLLAQYGTAQAGAIGHGSYVGQANIAQDIWRGSTVSDNAIQNELNSEILSGAIAPPDSNHLLFVFTPPDIVVSQGGSRSNGFPVGFAGYHNSFVDSSGQLVRYAVIPDPIGNDQVAGLSSFQQQTAASSHELAEAVTDPDGSSWWDNTNDSTSGYEVGDFADLNTDVLYLNGYAVEELWSNAAGGLVAPAGASSTPGTITLPVNIPPIITPPSSIPPTNGEPTSLGQVAASLTHGVQYDSTFITTEYQHLLSRAPDASGLNYWFAQMQTGSTDEQFEAELISSPEYVSLKGGTDSSWLLGVYSDLLGRTADSAGLDYWLAQLQAGESRYQVALTIATSPEHEALVIGGDYQTFLGRAANTVDLAYWTNAYEQGTQNEDIIAEFISSPEYYNGAAKGQTSATAWIDSVFLDLYQTTPSSSDLAYWLAQLG
jgi:hypothetical protein